MSADALEMSAITYDYARTTALRGVSMRVENGEIVSVTGPSGCGKSTLLHLACGILRVQEGKIRLLGRDLGQLHEADLSRLRRREVGIVLQFGQLVPELTVLDNVALPLLLDDYSRTDAYGAATAWLERVELVDVASALPGEISGGQAQCVAVARAMVTGPGVIFADEPTGSMDTRGGARLLQLLISVAREHATALVLVTHDNTVAAHADREVRLRDGLVEHEAVLR
jgi:putative ABC transport system ATP-binding protein